MPLRDVDLKKTVHLPATDFPMKANLPETEPRILARWQENGLYEHIRQARQGAPRFILHDGPPYANGKIHLGTAFNKILKDFIVKSKTMAGFDAPFIPGWDCHGLPIEIRVDSELGPKKASMTAVEIRQACRQYAQKWIDQQREDFRRLGILGRWDDPYLTMSASYESVIAQAFVDFLDQGYVFKGRKPVHWCLHCRTSLAEAEIEYEPHTSPSVYVRFAMVSEPGRMDRRLTGWRTYGVIWTTTPWTIPANLAISFHPEFSYSAVAIARAEKPEAKEIYLIATERVEKVAAVLGWSRYETVAEFSGQKLEGAVFRHPFLQRDSLGILGDHVTLEQGTGAVHTAPGHGQEDYLVGLRYGLAVYNPVDGAGRMFQAGGVAGDLPEVLLGKTVWEANELVLELLREHGALLHQERYEHSYPHCWRCHRPTIFRGTEQWFIGMERNDLRARTLEEIKRVKWLPVGGETRISNMIATRPDWNISRQRIWGVPITVFYCEDCGAAITNKAALDRVVERFREETADAWYHYSAQELLGPDFRCPSCGGGRFRKEMDILDVWFDSGASHLAVLEPNQLPWPADVYLEGGDQYRGWFHSSLLIGMALKGRAPYREVVTHGWTLDGQGRAMSKSLGNTIEPDKIVNRFGADVLRLWVASVEYSEDVRMSDEILARLSEAYRKIRNTIRYALGAINDFDPAHDTPTGDWPEIDRWILARLDRLIERVRHHYGQYKFHWAYQEIYSFCVTDLSAIYFDVSKDRLYTAAANARERRSAQAALYRIVHALVRLAAPILAFTADEAWQFLKRSGEASSVHLALFPEPGQPEALPAEFWPRWERLLAIREHVTKALELARQEKRIGANLEAQVHLKAGAEDYRLLAAYEADLPGLFIVSAVTLEASPDLPLAVQVERAAGAKCERCWKYRPDVGSEPQLPTVCLSCAQTVMQMLATEPRG